MMALCQVCGLPIAIGDYPCVFRPRPHQRGINGAIGDECDIWQENGFSTPQHFRHKSDLRRALAAKGLEIRVRHQPLPGTDTSPYTTNWSRAIDPVTLENARVLAERHGHATRDEPPEDALHVTWTIRERAS